MFICIYIHKYINFVCLNGIPTTEMCTAITCKWNESPNSVLRHCLEFHK